MTSFSQIREWIADEIERLNGDIASVLDSSNPLMNEVVANYLRTKGKQIRPVLVILSAKLFGKVNNDVISAAAAIELLHNASLIHDDVVDETKMRRGCAAINNIWDNRIAVLVGDFFVSTALQKAVETNNINIIGTIGNLGKMLSIGEIDQIYNARRHTISESDYFNVIYRKTASLFEACVELGAYAVGADDSRRKVISEFARLLGLCFQIRDDIFDYFEDKKVGKPTGNDLREGKITLPLLHVLADDTLPDHEAMVALSRKDELDGKQIRTLIEYAKRFGGIEYAYDNMQRLRNEAVTLLDTLPANEANEAFRSLIDFVIARDE